MCPAANLWSLANLLVHKLSIRGAPLGMLAHRVRSTINVDLNRECKIFTKNSHACKHTKQHPSSIFYKIFCEGNTPKTKNQQQDTFWVLCEGWILCTSCTERIPLRTTRHTWYHAPSAVVTTWLVVGNHLSAHWILEKGYLTPHTSRVTGPRTCPHRNETERTVAI